LRASSQAAAKGERYMEVDEFAAFLGKKPSEGR
jgi:hypothetical protein